MLPAEISNNAAPPCVPDDDHVLAQHTEHDSASDYDDVAVGNLSSPAEAEEPDQQIDTPIDAGNDTPAVVEPETGSVLDLHAPRSDADYHDDIPDDDELDVGSADASLTNNTITVGGRTFTVLFSDLMRGLTPSEYDGFKRDIETNGVRVPVVVDEFDNVIDGIHRLKATAELGLAEVLTQNVAGLTLEEKRQLAISLNAHRRHLAPAALAALHEQRVARVATKRREGKSLRIIAEEEQVCLRTIQRDLVTAATVSGDTVVPDDGKVKGKDGRSQPARRPRGKDKLPAQITDTDTDAPSKPAEVDQRTASQPAEKPRSLPAERMKVRLERLAQHARELKRKDLWGKGISNRTFGFLTGRKLKRAIEDCETMEEFLRAPCRLRLPPSRHHRGLRDDGGVLAGVTTGSVSALARVRAALAPGRPSARLTRPGQHTFSPPGPLTAAERFDAAAKSLLIHHGGIQPAAIVTCDPTCLLRTSRSVRGVWRSDHTFREPLVCVQHAA